MNHQNKAEDDEAPRTAIITGASCGLGLQCALNIARAKPHWHIVLACRRPLERALEAAEMVRQQTQNQQVEVVELDLASLASIRTFAKSITGRLRSWATAQERSKNDRGKADALPPLAALVCNAGVQVLSPTKTSDGFELTFGTNHLGHFLLINLLLCKIELDEDSLPQNALRILLVASATHDPAQKTAMPVPHYVKAQWTAFPEQDESEDKPQDDPATAGRRAYSWVWNNVLPLGTYLFNGWVRPEKSGQQLARLAWEEAFADELHSRYYIPSLQSVRSSEDSYNVEKQDELWQSSVDLVQLTADENPFP